MPLILSCLRLSQCQCSLTTPAMSALRLLSSAARSAPRASFALQRRGYAEAADKIKLSLVLPHQVRLILDDILTLEALTIGICSPFFRPLKSCRSTLPLQRVTWVSSLTTSRRLSPCALVSWRSSNRVTAARSGLVCSSNFLF